MKAKLNDIHAKLCVLHDHAKQRAHESGTLIIRDMIAPILDDLESIILADPAMVFPYDMTHDAIEKATRVEYAPMKPHDSGGKNLENYRVVIDVPRFRSEFLRYSMQAEETHDMIKPIPSVRWEPDVKTIGVLATALFKRFPDLAKAITTEAEKDPLTEFLNVLNTVE